MKQSGPRIELNGSLVESQCPASVRLYRIAELQQKNRLGSCRLYTGSTELQTQTLSVQDRLYIMCGNRQVPLGTDTRSLGQTKCVAATPDSLRPAFAVAKRSCL